jgi:hypothetical protein
VSDDGAQQAAGWVPEPPLPVPSPVNPAVAQSVSGAADRPELLVAGAFAGGLFTAMILKRLGR